MINQALILAGGLGTRLGDITKNVPKPMVPVGSKPFLELLMSHMASQDVKRFVLCIGYLAPVIQSHFGDGSRFGWHIDYSVEKDLLGTGGAIKKAFPLLEDNFLVLSGDNYLELDYPDLFKKFETSKGTGILSCWTNEPPLFRRNVKLDLSNSRILNYDFHSDADKNYVDVGVKIFSKKLADYFPAQEKFSLEVDVLAKIAAAGQLYGYPVKNPPLDVGTIEGLETVRKTLVRNEK